MLEVRLVRVGPISEEVLYEIGDGLEDRLGCETIRHPTALDPDFSFDAERGQYFATRILERLESLATDPDARILGISEVDLYLPVFTYVFGEAYLGRGAAVISLCRIRPEFYGLPPDPSLTKLRSLTEAIHELGHTFDLIHCPDYRCAMHASRSADEIDLKGPGFCSDCAGHLEQHGLVPRG